LLKSGLRERHFGRFAFHEQPRLERGIKHHHVATPLKAVERDADLDAEAVGGVFFFFQKIKEHQLAQQFFGRERHVFAPDGVEDERPFDRLGKPKLGLELQKVEVEQHRREGIAESAIAPVDSIKSDLPKKRHICHPMQTPDTQPFWHIIANPMARGGAMAAAWPQIEGLLQSMGFAYNVQFTERRGHAARLVEDAILRGGRCLLGIGGDGTNHEIVNGILGQTFAPATEVAYALLPFGTGNDWARQYGIPHDPRARLERLLKPQTVLQDAGRAHFFREGTADARYFVNVAGMAYDGFLGKKLTQRPARHKAQYLLMVAQYLFEYKLSRARISFDNQQVEDFFYTINVGLCRYSGGGMQLVPHAVPDDGLFALTFARQLSKLEVLLQTPRFYNGSLLRHSKVEGHQAKSIRVESLDGAPIFLEADGEYLGEAPATFEILEKALRVVL
jgi:diacylglycerol kinase (ATP)